MKLQTKFIMMVVFNLIALTSLAEKRVCVDGQGQRMQVSAETIQSQFQNTDSYFKTKSYEVLFDVLKGQQKISRVICVEEKKFTSVASQKMSRLARFENILSSCDAVKSFVYAAKDKQSKLYPGENVYVQTASIDLQALTDVEDEVMMLAVESQLKCEKQDQEEMLKAASSVIEKNAVLMSKIY